MRDRKDALQRAIPDALDLMVVCVEAGLGLDQAIARVGEEVERAHPALSDELNLLAMELRTGVSRQEALRNFAHRTDMEEARNLVALLVQTDRFGTSIGQALRVHADSMRTTRRLKAEELAAKLPVKLLFPLIFFIFPSMFIVLHWAGQHQNGSRVVSGADRPVIRSLQGADVSQCECLAMSLPAERFRKAALPIVLEGRFRSDATAWGILAFQGLRGEQEVVERHCARLVRNRGKTVGF